MSFVLSSDHLNSAPFPIFRSISCFFSRPTNIKESISNSTVADGSLSQMLRNSVCTFSSGKYISTPSRIIRTGLPYELTLSSQSVSNMDSDRQVLRSVSVRKRRRRSTASGRSRSNQCVTSGRPSRSYRASSPAPSCITTASGWRARNCRASLSISLARMQQPSCESFTLLNFEKS